MRVLDQPRLHGETKQDKRHGRYKEPCRSHLLGPLGVDGELSVQSCQGLVCGGEEAQSEREGLLEDMRQRRERRKHPEWTEDRAQELEAGMQWISQARCYFGPVVSSCGEGTGKDIESLGGGMRGVVVVLGLLGASAIRNKNHGPSISLWGYAGEKKNLKSWRTQRI